MSLVVIATPQIFGQRADISGVEPVIWFGRVLNVLFGFLLARPLFSWLWLF